MFKLLKISSPGKIILCGEHSVVYGKKALACSINLRTTLTASYSLNSKFSLKLNDLNKLIEFEKDEFMTLRSSCSKNDPDSILNFLEITETDKIYGSVIFFILSQNQLDWSKFCGLSVEVNSEIPLASGLGSSASYATCCSALFYIISNGSRNFSTQDLEIINKNAFFIEKIFHGKPSGLDNSVSTYGNFIVFEKGTITQKFNSATNLNVLITNSNIPKKTLEQVQKVRYLYEKHTKVVESLMNAIDILVEDFITHLKESKSEEKLKDLISINQGLLYSLQVSNYELNSIINLTQKFGFNSKITGAGGGGCCITLLDNNNNFENRINNLISSLIENNFTPFQTKLGCEGIRVEEFLE
ncbi:unnamed protein product [Brachionus calyciflorus]|uniref:Mevalonate kinase n=1 Tax=Brachionus calyciflorus TaxID=104777 RepID=A0A813QZ37_9BILA|nr:unnamed protein product [Brachionus calyciflorus]